MFLRRFMTLKLGINGKGLITNIAVISLFGNVVRDPAFEFGSFEDFGNARGRVSVLL